MLDGNELCQSAILACKSRLLTKQFNLTIRELRLQSHWEIRPIIHNFYRIKKGFYKLSK